MSTDLEHCTRFCCWCCWCCFCIFIFVCFVVDPTPFIFNLRTLLRNQQWMYFSFRCQLLLACNEIKRNGVFSDTLVSIYNTWVLLPISAVFVWSNFPQNKNSITVFSAHNRNNMTRSLLVENPLQIAITTQQFCWCEIQRHGIVWWTWETRFLLSWRLFYWIQCSPNQVKSNQGRLCKFFVWTLCEKQLHHFAN